MTQEEIIRMAREVGLASTLQPNDAMLMRFAQLVAEAEREACAKVCDKNGETAVNAQKIKDGNDLSDIFLRHHASAHFQSAAAIRARGQQ